MHVDQTPMQDISNMLVQHHHHHYNRQLVDAMQNLTQVAQVDARNLSQTVQLYAPNYNVTQLNHATQYINNHYEQIVKLAQDNRVSINTVVKQILLMRPPENPNPNPDDNAI